MSQLITDPNRAARLSGVFNNNVNLKEVPDSTVEWALQHPQEAGQRYTSFLKDLGSVITTETKIKALSFRLGFCPYEFEIYKDGADAVELENRVGGNSALWGISEKMMRGLIIGPTEEVTIRVYSAGVLGVAGCLYAEFFGPQGWGYLKGLGLSQCHAEDAFYIRRAHDEQKLNEQILVAHTPISTKINGLIVFDVWHSRHSDSGRCVSAYSIGSSDHIFGVDELIAVRVATS
ncbi:MAG: hypothetical protein WCF92_03115 [bacterium]